MLITIELLRCQSSYSKLIIPISDFHRTSIECPAMIVSNSYKEILAALAVLNNTFVELDYMPF